MPLMTRRSSTRSTPRTSVGRRGSIRFHCSSFSQNRFLRTIPIPSKNESGSYCQSGKLMSSDPSLLGHGAMDLFDLNGHVAIITGGNAGIGFGIAKGLAAAGATIVIAGRRAEKNLEAARAIEVFNVKTAALEVDV